MLKISDLSRKGGLSNAQVNRGFRYGPHLGDSNKGSEAPQIHTHILCLAGIRSQHNYALDGTQIEDQSYAQREKSVPALCQARLYERRIREHPYGE